MEARGPSVGRIPRMNLGSGRVRIQGWVNVDVLGGDVRAVGEALPFRDNAFEYVLASHVLEHVDDLRKPMRAIHRVLQRGGQSS